MIDDSHTKSRSLIVIDLIDVSALLEAFWIDVSQQHNLLPDTQVLSS